MKILLIMPGRSQFNFKEKGKSKPWLPPGSLLEVAGLTPEQHEVTIWDELSQGHLTDENLPQADLYGVGGLSTSRYGAYRVANLIKNTGGKVIAGGMDVTGQYHDGAEAELLNHYDSIVVGRLTRKLWAKALDDFSKGDLKPKYMADPSDPWEFTVPRIDLIDPSNYFIPAVIRSSAGCSEKCPFCTVHLVIGKRAVVCHKPTDVLEKELANLPQSRFMVDASDSFGADYKRTLTDTLPILKSTGRSWFTEITIKNLIGAENDREELITPMAKAGCTGVYIGIESIFDSVSGKSLGIKTTEDAIKRSHDAGLLVMGALILDVTGKETMDSIKRTVDWVIEQKLDFLQYSLLALLPGSKTREVAISNNKVLDNNPEHLDGAWPTIEHPMPPAERLKALQYAYRETYSVRNILKRLARVNVSQRLGISAANYQIHRTASAWQKQASYQHWLNTKQPLTTS